MADQLTFNDISGRRRRHRAVVADAEAVAARRSAHHDALRYELARYLRVHGVGHRFQAVDFLRWTERHAARPSALVGDMRATGGLFAGLARAGVLARRGYEPNGGCESRRYHSTVRPVYVVQHLRFPEGWCPC